MKGVLCLQFCLLVAFVAQAGGLAGTPEASARRWVPISLERGEATQRSVEGEPSALRVDHWDGQPRVIAARSGDVGGSIAVWSGRELRRFEAPLGTPGPSRFDTPPTLSSSTLRPDLIAVIDGDGDQHLDLIVAERAGTRIEFLRGRGGGLFEQRGTFDLGVAIDRLEVVARWGDAVGRELLVVSEEGELSILDHPAGALRPTDRGADGVLRVARELRVEPTRHYQLGGPVESFATIRDGGGWLPAFAVNGSWMLIRDDGIEKMERLPRSPIDELDRIRQVESVPVEVRRTLGHDVAVRPVAVSALQLNRDRHHDFVVWFEGEETPSLLLSGGTGVMVVTTTADDVNVDGICTLREAIIKGNAGTFGGDCGIAIAESIVFDIPGVDVATLTPTEPLPPIGEGVLVDAITLGCAEGPCLELDTSAFPPGEPGLRLEGTSAAVRGFAIGNVDGAAILGTASAQGIRDCYLGTDRSGTLPRPNEVGVRQLSGFVSVASSVISANLSHGIDSQSSLTVQSSLIGWDASGSVPMLNGGNGIRHAGAGGNLTVTEVEFPGDTLPGIHVVNGGSIQLTEVNLSDSDSSGLVVDGATGVTIQGSTFASNAGWGIEFGSGTQETRIFGSVVGGDDPSDGNALGGVRLIDTIGGAYGSDNFESTQNDFRHNGGPALLLAGTSTGHRIAGNRFANNDGLAIDLSLDPNVPDGVTPNDDGDADAGPNGLQNFPVVNDLTIGIDEIQLDLSLEGEPERLYELRVFQVDQPDPSGHGEGSLPIAFIEVMSDATGSVQFDGAIPTPDPTPFQLTVTATCADCATGGTSEFSANAFFDWTVEDDDGDGTDNLADCLPTDPEVWAPSSSQIDDLLLGKQEAATELTWSSPIPSGAIPSLQRFDVLSAPTPTAFVEATVDPVELNIAQTSALDPRIPQPNALFFYLVRADNPCAPAPAGSDSTGALRSIEFAIANMRDDGPGSLRQAIEEAAPDSRLIVDLSGWLELQEDIEIRKSLELVGPGVNRLRVAGDSLFYPERFEAREGADLVLTDLSIGSVIAGSIGGDPAKVSLRRMRVGPADNAVISGLQGDVTVRESLLVAGGRGVWAPGGAVHLENTTVYNASQSVVGADVGLFADNGSIDATSSTILVDNGTVAESTGILTLRNCVLISRLAETCVGNVTSNGYNVSTGCSALGAVGDQDVVDPMLSDLQFNGGELETMLPLVGSPLLDAGSCPGLGIDQRERGRPVDDPLLPNVDDGCDVGAVERQPDDLP